MPPLILSFLFISSISCSDPWQCYRWTKADNATGRVGTAAEGSLCEEKTNYTQGWELRYREGGTTCGGCWCCKRQNYEDPTAGMIVGSWQCYHWDSADVATGMTGNVAEGALCLSKTNFTNNVQFAFPAQDSYCGGCWCCNRSVHSPPQNQTAQNVVNSDNFNQVFAETLTQQTGQAYVVVNLGLFNALKIVGSVLAAGFFVFDVFLVYWKCFRKPKNAGSRENDEKLSRN